MHNTTGIHLTIRRYVLSVAESNPAAPLVPGALKQTQRFQGVVSTLANKYDKTPADVEEMIIK